MTTPTPALIDDRFEVFRVIDDPEMLVEAFRDRVEDLNTTRLGIDEAGGFTAGHASKLLCIPQIKGYGPESMFKMLKGTRLALMLVIDDERFAKAKPELVKRQRPAPKQANAGSVRPTWLFKRKKARQMGKKRMAGLTEAQRKKLARKGGKASGKSRRLRSRLKRRVTPSASPAPPPAQ
jgi:hypothetical protein